MLSRAKRVAGAWTVVLVGACSARHSLQTNTTSPFDASLSDAAIGGEAGLAGQMLADGAIADGARGGASEAGKGDAGGGSDGGSADGTVPTPSDSGLADAGYVSSITKDGVTWTFAQPLLAGQFV